METTAEKVIRFAVYGFGCTAIVGAVLIGREWFKGKNINDHPKKTIDIHDSLAR